MSLLRIEVVRRPAELELHAAAWDALAAATPWPSPLRTHAWFATHVEQKLGADERWLALLAYQGERLRGVLPLVEEGARTLGLKRSRWRVPGEYYTEEGDALLAEGLEALTLGALLEALDREQRGALGVTLGGIAPGSSTLRALRTGNAPFSAAVDHDAQGAWVPIEGTFDAWWHGISENLRINLRKARNRLEREHPGQLAFRFLSGAQAGPEHLEAFARLEEAGWKGEEGGALARSQPKLALYRTLASRWAARGWLEWHLATLGGRPVAMHMAVRLGRRLTLLRICYDESLGKHMPGNLLLREMVAREHAGALSDGIDFVQHQPWNAHWRMPRYDFVRAHVARPGLLPALVGALPLRAAAALHRTPRLAALFRRLRGR